MKEPEHIIKEIIILKTKDENTTNINNYNTRDYQNRMSL